VGLESRSRFRENLDGRARPEGALMERIFVHTEERRRILEPGFVSREGVSSKPSF